MLSKMKLTYVQKQKTKKIIKYICIIAAIIMLYLNVSVSFNLFGSYGCISVVYDKWDMMHVNKIYLQVGENRYEVSDPMLIDRIVDTTMVASMGGVQYFPDIKMELYHNNKLVRRMSYGIGCGAAKVYEADMEHWVWPSSTGEGFVHFPTELIDRLQEIIDTEETP